MLWAIVFLFFLPIKSYYSTFLVQVIDIYFKMNFSFKCNLLYPETDFQKTIFLTPELNLLGDNTSLAQAVYVGVFPSQHVLYTKVTELAYLLDWQPNYIDEIFVFLNLEFPALFSDYMPIFGAKVALKNQLLPLNMLLTGKDTYLPNLEKKKLPHKITSHTKMNSSLCNHCGNLNRPAW